MVNPDVLHRRLTKLDESLDYLESAQRYSYREFADDPEHRRAVERVLHLSVEALTDMASHVVADDDLGSVDRAKDLPDIFVGHGYVNEEMAATWKDMIGFRNVLVHEYVDIDSTDPWESKGKAFSHQMGTEYNREQQRISETYSLIGKRVYDVLQNHLDDIRRLRRVFGHFL